jgi:hypothetical protein
LGPWFLRYRNGWRILWPQNVVVPDCYIQANEYYHASAGGDLVYFHMGCYIQNRHQQRQVLYIFAVLCLESQFRFGEVVAAEVVDDTCFTDCVDSALPEWFQFWGCILN